VSKIISSRGFSRFERDKEDEQKNMRRSQSYGECYFAKSDDVGAEAEKPQQE